MKTMTFSIHDDADNSRCSVTAQSNSDLVQDFWEQGMALLGGLLVSYGIHPENIADLLALDGMDETKIEEN